MKESLKLKDYINQSSGKMFTLLGFVDGCATEIIFSLDEDFETLEDGEFPSELFYSMCEIVDDINSMQFEEEMRCQLCRRAETNRDLGVIRRIR